MPVSTQHTDYNYRYPQWERCRTVVEGKDALMVADLAYKGVSSNKAPVATAKFVPSPSGLTYAEYASYLSRASFFNATQRSIDAFIGLIQAKPAALDYPKGYQHHLEDVTLSGQPLREFVQKVLEEEFLTTRQAILVDYAQLNTARLSALDLERSNLRPYLTHYKAEQILNWKEAEVNGRTQLVSIRLREIVESPDPEDEFTQLTNTQYRVLDLEPETGYYRVRIYNDSGALKSEPVYPKMNGEFMFTIPIVLVGGTKVRKPLMLDMVDTNIAHFRNSADYEHGLHFTALPTPILTGVSTQEGEEGFRIGSLAAWVLQNPDSKAYFLEFQGKGLDGIKEAMKDKEFRMAVMGARMLADEKRASESLGTVEIRTAGERSILFNIASDVSDAIRKALKWMCAWVGQDAPTVRYHLNMDYGMNKLTHQQIAALMKSWQEGGITHNTLFENLQRGDVISPDERYDSYKEKLLDEEYNLVVPKALTGEEGEQEVLPQEPENN